MTYIKPDAFKEVIEGYFNGTNFYTDALFTDLITPESSKIYLNIAVTPATQYRWSGSSYVEIGGGVTDDIVSSLWSWSLFYTADAKVGNFNGLALNSGTISAAIIPSGIVNYQNMKQFNSSTSANSGYRYLTVTPSGPGSSRFFNQAGLTFYATFCIYENSNADTVIRLGFADTITQADAGNGAYIEITTNSVVFKTAKGGVRSSSSSASLSYSSSTTSEVPYDVMIYFETTSLIRCKIKKYDGTVVLDTSLSTNTPLTTSGLHCISIGSITTAGTARPIYGLQKIGLGYKKPNFLNNF